VFLKNKLKKIPDQVRDDDVVIIRLNEQLLS